MIRLSLALMLLAAGCLSAPSPVNKDGGGIDASLTGDAGEAGDGPVASDAHIAADVPRLPMCDSTGPKKVRQISAGFEHTCAVLTTGQLYCWGNGGAGRLGLGSTANVGASNTPATDGEVSLGGECAVQVAAGGSHTCVLLSTGGIRCWGGDASGQLGVDVAPETDVTSPPLTDVDLDGDVVVQVVAGATHTCVRLDDGNVRCFGGAGAGQLGWSPGSLTGALTTNIDLGGRGAVHISAGTTHTCVRLDDGAVKCWGTHGQGALGYGDSNAGPVTASGGGDVMIGGTATSVSTGNHHTCAVVDGSSTNGVVRCWGRGAYGRLGNENMLDVGFAEHPASIPALDFGTPASAISAGGSHTCVLVAGKVRCWGAGISGQTGYHNSPYCGTSVKDIGDHPDRPLLLDLDTGIEPIIQIATGSQHTCALSDTGLVRCWGDPSQGKLGHGNTDKIGACGNSIVAGGNVPVWCNGGTIPCE